VYKYGGILWRHLRRVLFTVKVPMQYHKQRTRECCVKVKDDRYKSAERFKYYPLSYPHVLSNWVENGCGWWCWTTHQYCSVWSIVDHNWRSSVDGWNIRFLWLNAHLDQNRRAARAKWLHTRGLRIGLHLVLGVGPILPQQFGALAPKTPTILSQISDFPEYEVI